MSRHLFAVAAALLIFAAASRAGDTAASPDAPAAPSSPASSDADSSAAPATDSAPDAKSEPKPEAKPEAKPDAKPEAKPEAKAAAKAEPKSEPKAVAKDEDAPAEAPADVKAAVKPLNPCAAKLQPAVDSYQKAHDDLLEWLRSASGKMDAADGRIADLKKLIAEKEGSITQLKLEDAQKNEAKISSLGQETKDLWTQLKGEEGRRKDLCKALSTSAGAKVREMNRSVLEQFDKAAATP